MIKNFITACIITMLFSSTASAQDSTKHVSPFTWSAYVDVYWAYYTDSVGRNNYQKFPSVSPRSNQFGLNVAMLSLKYATDKVRANATVHYGDIPLSAWSSKYNFIQEANAGILLCKNLWLDGGFFRTHFGTEALFPKENYTSSISVPTFFEPYFESGFRLNYNPTKKLSFFVYALNGYGVYEDNNNKKSAGLLVTYIFNDKVNIGYSGYYGDDSQQGRHLRLAHNAFLNFKGKKLKLTVGGDFITQQHSGISNPKKSAAIESGVLILSYDATKKVRLYTRGEIYNDPKGILSGVFIDANNNPTGLKIWGATAGIEFKPVENAYIRIEGRYLSANADQEIFRWNTESTNQRWETMIHLGVSF
ncbi:MAG: outer membrane beta-barrel protein [Ferruginibacter sp.]